MLQAEVGTHNGHGEDPLMPKGIQVVMMEGVKDIQASKVWELDEEDAVFALLAGNIKAKGLKPLTINKVKIQPDWPKWEDTINTKLKSLDNTHTWNVVEHPKTPTL